MVSSFESELFQTFLQKDGITFKTGAPYSPKTNVVEISVKTVKRASRATLCEVEVEELDISLQSLLLDSRNTPHGTTNV